MSETAIKFRDDSQPSLIDVLEDINKTSSCIIVMSSNLKQSLLGDAMTARLSSVEYKNDHAGIIETKSYMATSKQAIKELRKALDVLEQITYAMHEKNAESDIMSSDELDKKEFPFSIWGSAEEIKNLTKKLSEVIGEIDREIFSNSLKNSGTINVADTKAIPESVYAILTDTSKRLNNSSSEISRIMLRVGDRREKNEG